MSNKIEQVGEKFCRDKYLEAREKTILAVKQIASLVEIGMNEEEGQTLVDEVLAKHGVEKKWHPTKFRIGVNTTKSFRDKSEVGITLKSEDIFFIDIGPVFESHEGDYGETFIVGHNEEYSAIKNACEDVFTKTAKKCREENYTGEKLYQFATKYAQELGYELNLKMSGHRLGDFPHAIHFKGSLGSIDTTPAQDLWILEIHIRHPEKEFGAFFEDII